MDIQIKYKEVDKKAEVTKLLIKVKKTPYYVGEVELADKIDKLYKEESKEIESINIVNDDIKILIGYLSETKQLIAVVKTDIAIGSQFTEVFDKKALGQYIDILTKIHNQMD
jgi:hypothetical protein